MTRIAHLINTLNQGGAEQITASLALRQRRGGHELCVICLRDIGAQSVDISELVRAGVEIVELGKPEGLHFATLRRLREQLVRRRIEVLHTHNHLVLHYGAIAGLWARVPVILNSLHGTASLQTSAAWSRALFWLSCLPVSRVVCVDPRVYEIVRKSYPLLGGRLCVIENGADLGRFLSLPPRAPGATLTFGNIGRLEPVKAHDVLLRAFAMLHREDPRLRLRILGDGDRWDELRALAEQLSIRDAVGFEGFSLDTARFLDNIDVYVISSLSEGLPLTLLEAMAAGRPVVATAVGGVTGIIEHSGCGWLCAPANPRALADAMRRALHAPDLAATGERGRQFAMKSYSVERMARDYERLYNELLA